MIVPAPYHSVTSVMASPPTWGTETCCYIVRASVAVASRIFISYRRGDTTAYAGRLYDYLTARFGEDNVFMDVDTIEPGLDFVEVIEGAVGSCQVFLALIGDAWLTETGQTGRRRLDNPEDFVRLEVAASLKRGIRVIPVLVQGASMPSSSELPEPLAKLARRHAFDVSDLRWRQDVERLMTTIEKVLAGAEPGKAVLESKQDEEVQLADVSAPAGAAKTESQSGAEAGRAEEHVPSTSQSRPGQSQGRDGEAPPPQKGHGQPGSDGKRRMRKPLLRPVIALAACLVAIGATVALAALLNDPPDPKPDSHPDPKPQDEPSDRGSKGTKFATPANAGAQYPAAYCRVENSSAALYCWTPNDGYTLAMDTSRPFRRVPDDELNKGKAPDGYRTLSFGERSSFGDFTCTSGRKNLSCLNLSGHGFSLPRYRGLPRRLGP